MCKRKQRALLKTDTYSLFSKFIDNSEFIGFLLLKYSNFGDFIRLKQIFYSFGIKIFMPRTKLLKNFLKSNFDKKIFGKLIIIYLSEGIKVVSIKQVLDFLKNNLLLVPLFFYINNKFIYSCNFFNLEFEKKKSFFQLINVLNKHLEITLSFLTLTNQFTLNIYELYKSIKKN